MTVRAGFVGLLTVLLVAIPGLASAKFSGGASASASVSTDTLAPPTNLVVTKDCAKSLGSTFTLTWTPTSDGYATGYNVTVTKGGSSQTYSLPGQATSSYSTTAAWLTTVRFTLVTVYGNWTSASVTTQSALCP